uniref:Translocated actin-recruiting phosphoprotein n=13 Tax=Chlamydia pecorum TaxID=85991 RepID=F6KP67_9CHLA|nr:translocated actin-recruiting phosphoprotein [Chlamydia pecorum]
MTSRINGPSITTQITSTETTTTTTTVGSLGEHTVTTSATGQPETTAQTTSTAAETVISDISSQEGSPSEVLFSSERSISTEPPTTGGAGASAAATHTLGMQRLRPSSSSSSSSTISSSDDAGETTSTQQSPDLGDLQGLHGSERSEGTMGAEGPGGLPETAIPPYDPSSKASIINFLKSPAVQQRMQTKGGHFVFIDETRSSFIFVRNGDWNTAESIKITNAKTGENISQPKDLEMCVAKFCVAYETMQSDWVTNIQPRVSERAGGAQGTYDHLMLSFKFKTAVLYGPWNSKEASSGYTPSAWRRGTKVETGPIWKDVGGLQGINWKTTPKPEFDDASFTRETPGAGQSSGAPAPSPYAAPIINVNLGGISTNVSVGGTTTTTTVNTGGTASQTEETTSTTTEESDNSFETASAGDDIETASTSSGGTIEEPTLHYEEEGNGEDDMSPPPPPGPPPASSSVSGITGMSASTFKDVLKAVAAHNRVVWGTDGEHISGANQDLGTVVRNAEHGIFNPTVIQNGGDSVSGADQGGSDGGAGGASGSGGGNRTRGSGQGEDGVVDNRDLLGKIRAHLDSVYPTENLTPDGTTLGDIIKNEEGSGGESEGFVTANPQAGPARMATRVVQNTETSETATSQQATASSGTAEAASSSGASGSQSSSGPSSAGNDTGRTQRGGTGDGSRVNTSSTTSRMVGKQFENTQDNRDLLAKIRAHLDAVYPTENLTPDGTTLGDIIKNEEGSGGASEGFVTANPQAGPARMATRIVQNTGTSETASSQQAVPSSSPSRLQQASERLQGALGDPAGRSTRADLHSAAREVADSLNTMAGIVRLNTPPSVLTSDDSSSTGMGLLAAARDVAQSLTKTLDNFN